MARLPGLSSRASAASGGLCNRAAASWPATSAAQQLLFPTAAARPAAAGGSQLQRPLGDTRHLRLLAPTHPAGCSGANLMGFIKCSKAAQSQIKGKFNSLFTSGLKAYMFGRS